MAYVSYVSNKYKENDNETLAYIRTALYNIYFASVLLPTLDAPLMNVFTRRSGIIFFCMQQIVFYSKNESFLFSSHKSLMTTV